MAPWLVTWWADEMALIALAWNALLVDVESLKMGQPGKWKASKIRNLEIPMFGKFGNRKIWKMRNVATLKYGEIKTSKKCR